MTAQPAPRAGHADGAAGRSADGTANDRATEAASLQRLARVLTGLTVVVIVYGSLYPLRWHAPADWGLALRELLVPKGWSSLMSGTGDIIGNVLLFMPLSAVGGWWLRDRSRWVRWGWLGLGGALLGLLLQVAQLAIPARDPALADAWWNLIGLVLGVGCVGLVPPVLRMLRARLHSPHFGAYTVAAFWLCLAWWPLLPGLNSWWMRAIWRQLWNLHRAVPVDAWLQAVGVFLLAQALRALPARAAVLLGVVLAGWLGKLLFAFTLPANMPANTVGFALGGVAGMLAWALRERTALWLMIAVAGAAMATDGLQGALASPLAQASAVQWWPLVPALGDQRVAYTHGLLVWAWWLGAAGAAALRLGARPWLLWPGITAALAVLEWAQRDWPDQQADVTMVLLPALCAGLLAWAARRQWWQPGPSATPLGPSPTGR